MCDGATASHLSPGDYAARRVLCACPCLSRAAEPHVRLLFSQTGCRVCTSPLHTLHTWRCSLTARLESRNQRSRTRNKSVRAHGRGIALCPDRPPLEVARLQARHAPTTGGGDHPRCLGHFLRCLYIVPGVRPSFALRVPPSAGWKPSPRPNAPNAPRAQRVPRLNHGSCLLSFTCQSER